MPRRIIITPGELDSAVESVRGPHTISSVYVAATAELLRTRTPEQIRLLLTATDAPLRGGTTGRPKGQVRNKLGK